MGPPNLDPNELMAGIADIDAARIALRWALERIRALEGGSVSPSERAAFAAESEAAKRQVAAAWRELQRRQSSLSLREGFVSDMRRLLNGRLEGDGEVERALEARQRLDTELSLVRDSAERRLDAETAALKAALETERRRLVEVERGLSVAMEAPLREQALALRGENALALEKARTEWVAQRTSLEGLIEALRADSEASAGALKARLAESETRAAAALEAGRVREAEAQRAQLEAAAEGRRSADEAKSRTEVERLGQACARLEARLAESETRAAAALEAGRVREAEAQRAQLETAAEGRRSADEAKSRTEAERLDQSCARLEALLSKAGSAAPRTPPSPASPGGPDTVAEIRPIRRGVRTLLVGVVALAVCAGIYRFKGRSGADHLLPTSHPSALVWAGDSLWVADWHDGSIHVLAKTRSGLRPLRKYALAGVHPVGLAVGRDRVYVADAWSRRIERRRLDAQLTLETSVASPGPKPSGLFYDGKYLWSVDQSLGRVYQHADDDALTVLSEFSVPHAPLGVFYGEAGFWTADARTSDLVRHNPPPSVEVNGSFRLPELAADARPFSAFTWNGGRLWAARDGSATLLERSAGTLVERSR